MSNPVYNSTDNPVTLNYSAMPLPPGTTKTGEVFQGQKTHFEKSTEGKKSEDSSSLMAQADSSIEKGNQAYSKKQYHSAYLHHLEAKRCYELLPRNNATTKKLVTAYYNIAVAAKLVRQDRRQTVTCCGPFLVMLPFIGCCLFKSALDNSEWVDNETFRSHIDNGIKFLSQFIEGIEKDNNISMNTDKKTISEQVRKDLGWAHNEIANFYGIGENMAPPGCSDAEEIASNAGAGDASACNYSDCCFKGTDGGTNASRYSNSKRAAHLELAKEWDPSNPAYKARHQQLDSYMKAPTIIHETYIHH